MNREMLAMCSFPFCEGKCGRVDAAPPSTEAAQRGVMQRVVQDLSEHEKLTSIQQPLKQAMQFFAESVSGRGGAGLAPSAPRSVSWVLHACAEVEKHKHQN